MAFETHIILKELLFKEKLAETYLGMSYASMDCGHQFQTSLKNCTS